MKTIKNTKDAIDYIQDVVGIEVSDLTKWKYHLKDNEVDFYVKDDKELIEYANEQKEALEDEEEEE